MKFGITQPFPCSYLQNNEEQLVVLVEEKQATTAQYETLIDLGFRRSGEQVYKPNCPNCTACHSIRLPVEQFKPSKSQKRVLSKNSDLELRYSDAPKEDYYHLYERYIKQRHADGSMYPPNKEQYDSFISVSWMSSLFIEFWLSNELIGVAVTDELQDSLSALYTFFEPKQAIRSIGTFSIMAQVAKAKDMGKRYLYLGYQVDNCNKMNYKQKFLPHERFLDNKWQLIVKNPQ